MPNNCAICDRLFTGNDWVCYSCAKRWELVGVPFAKWPEWVKELANSEHAERRTAVEDAQYLIDIPEGVADIGDWDELDIYPRQELLTDPTPRPTEDEALDNVCEPPEVRVFDDPHQNLALAILRKAAQELDSPVMEEEQGAKEFLKSDIAAGLIRIVEFDRAEALQLLGIESD